VKKKCNTCKKEKDLSEFHNSKSKSDGKQANCKQCNNEKARAWQTENYDQFKKHWEKQKTAEALWKRKARRYNISVEELKLLFSLNDGTCTICKRYPSNFLVIDHCHTKNIVRGILCEKCNQALGLMDDNIEYLLNMIQYLKDNE
jgi:hypothetical protein